MLPVHCIQAAANVEIKAEHPIQLRDVQQLVLWVLAEAISTRWAFIKVGCNKSIDCTAAERYISIQYLLPSDPAN